MLVLPHKPQLDEIVPKRWAKLSFIYGRYGETPINTGFKESERILLEYESTRGPPIKIGFP